MVHSPLLFWIRERRDLIGHYWGSVARAFGGFDGFSCLSGVWREVEIHRELVDQVVEEDTDQEVAGVVVDEEDEGAVVLALVRRVVIQSRRGLSLQEGDKTEPKFPISVQFQFSQREKESPNDPNTKPIFLQQPLLLWRAFRPFLRRLLLRSSSLNDSPWSRTPLCPGSWLDETFSPKQRLERARQWASSSLPWSVSLLQSKEQHLKRSQCL